MSGHSWWNETTLNFREVTGLHCSSACSNYSKVHQAASLKMPICCLTGSFEYTRMCVYWICVLHVAVKTMWTVYLERGRYESESSGFAASDVRKTATTWWEEVSWEFCECFHVVSFSASMFISMWQGFINTRQLRSDRCVCVCMFWTCVSSGLANLFSPKQQPGNHASL